MLQELKTFISVVELNNLTECSKRLKLSPKLIIEHIKVLELFFGVILIDKPIIGDNLSITENGEKLYKKSKKMFNLVEDGNYDNIQQINTLKGNIKIGICTSFEKYILPKFLSYFSKKCPNIKLDITKESNDCIYKHLKENILHIGIIEDITHETGFIQKRFLSDKMVLIIPYARTIKDISTYVNEYKTKIWFTSNEDLSTEYFTNKFLDSNNIKVESTLLDNNEAVKESIKNNLGIGIMPKSAVISDYKNKEISLLPLEKALSKYYAYVVPDNVNLSECIEVFLNELKDYYKYIYCY